MGVIYYDKVGVIWTENFIFAHDHLNNEIFVKQTMNNFLEYVNLVHEGLEAVILPTSG